MTDACRRIVPRYPQPKFIKFGKKCRLVRPTRLPNFVALPQEMSLRYPMSKIFAPGKVDHSLSNSLNTCYAPMPLIMSNFIALGRTKALQNFLHPQYFGAPGALYVKVHQFWQASPSTKLSNLVAFGDGLTDKTHTKTVNDMFPHAYHKAIIITSNSSLLF